MWSTRFHLLSSRILRAIRRKPSLRRRASTGSPVRGGAGGGGGPRGVKATASDGGGRGGWGGAIWAAYLSELDKRPVLTKMWTSGIINALGDILAQNLFESSSPFSFKRLFVFANLGLLVVGPTLHVWYGVLARIFATPGLRSATGSLMLDQFLFAPGFCATILSLLVVEETRQLSSVRPKLEQDWVPTVLMNWKIWIPAQLVNFWVVPPNLRVLFANVVALVWTTYLSYASYKRVQSHAVA